MQPPRCGPGAEPEPGPGQHQRRSAEPRAAGLLQALLPHLAPLQASLQDQPALQAGHLLPLQRPPDGHDKQPGYVLRQNLKHFIWISFYRLTKNLATLDIVRYLQIQMTKASNTGRMLFVLLRIKCKYKILPHKMCRYLLF